MRFFFSFVQLLPRSVPNATLKLFKQLDRAVVEVSVVVVVQFHDPLIPFVHPTN